jgi:hypothetical protein
MSSANITYSGVDLVVEYDYSPEERQTLEYPGYPEHVEICEVLVNGVDIISLLDTDAIEALESEVLEDRYGHQQQAEEDRAEARWQDQQDRIAEGDYL